MKLAPTADSGDAAKGWALAQMSFWIKSALGGRPRLLVKAWSYLPHSVRDSKTLRQSCLDRTLIAVAEAITVCNFCGNGINRDAAYTKRIFRAAGLMTNIHLIVAATHVFDIHEKARACL